MSPHKVSNRKPDKRKYFKGIMKTVRDKRLVKIKELVESRKNYWQDTAQIEDAETEQRDRQEKRDKDDII